MNLALLEVWARSRDKGARLLAWDDIPPRHQVDRSSAATHRCAAALPRTNVLGKCFFVRCKNSGRGSFKSPLLSLPWCYAHRGGTRVKTTRKRRPKAAQEAAQ